MSRGAWTCAALAGALAGGALGCAQRQAWQHDESRRIDEVMRATELSSDLAALNGTPFAAAPSNAPALGSRSYEIQQAPPKKRHKSHRNTRATRRRSGLGGDLTSPDAAADSASRRP